MAAETPLMRYEPRGHGQCACKGASAHPMAGSVGDIGHWGYEITEGKTKRIVCSACVTKLLKDETK